MRDIRLALVTIPASIFYWIKKAEVSDWFLVAIYLLILSGIGLCLGSGYYLGKWMAICASMIMYLVGKAHEKYGAAAAAMIAYCSGSALWVLMAESRYSTLNPYDLLGLRYFAFDSLAKLIIIVAPFLLVNMNRETMGRIGRMTVTAFCLISLFQVFAEAIMSGCKEVNSCGGALRNPSMNDSMLAVSLPIVASVIPFGWAFVIPTAITSMLAKSAIGTGMCALYVGLLAWRGANAKNLGRSTLLIFGVVPAIFALGYVTHGSKVFFDSSGRFQMWHFFMSKWILNWKNWSFGAGFGTFGVFSQNLQQHFVINPNDWWIWMHNDWLQMAFECGIAGLAIMVWMYVTCAWKLRRSAPELQSLLLFGVMMGCEYPMHVAPSCLYAAWIAAYALMQPSENDALCD